MSPGSIVLTVMLFLTLGVLIVALGRFLWLTTMIPAEQHSEEHRTLVDAWAIVAYISLIAIVVIAVIGIPTLNHFGL